MSIMAKKQSSTPGVVKQIRIVCESTRAFDKIADWLTNYDSSEIPEKIVKGKEFNISVSEDWFDAIVEILPQLMDKVKDVKAFIDEKELSLESGAAASSEVADLMAVIVDEFKKDPRNKVFGSIEFILSFVKDETGKTPDIVEFEKIINSYQAGKLKGKSNTLIYDAAVFACNSLGRACFNLDDDHDCSITWLENNGSIIAEIRQ